jgi:hypothetical protein
MSDRSSSKNNEKWSWYQIVIIFVIFIISVIPIDLTHKIDAELQILIRWMWVMICLTTITMIASKIISGSPFSWLINKQNRLSLSQLQMFLWTIMVFSAIFVSVIENIYGGYLIGSIDIEIPEELWIAMGISTGSLVSSRVILDNKISDSLETAFKPKLLDLVRSEIANTEKEIDLSRVQNLLITILLFFVYFTSLGSNLLHEVIRYGEMPINKFPELNASFAWLLAISHGGYLVMKYNKGDNLNMNDGNNNTGTEQSPTPKLNGKKI